LQLGDIVVSNGAGHVGLYVGGGYVIDALNSGTPIEKISIRYGWYAASVIGAVRP
jgi:cell wall-associated NlpC family hydrolase